MAIIYLIRHGQASFGAEDYDSLSELGQSQAQRMGEVLFERIGAPDLVLSGTMLRHQQTRDLALRSGAIQVSHQEHADWNEYDHQAVLAALDPRLKTAKGTRELLAQSDDPNKQFASLFAQAIARWQSAENNDYPESWLAFKSRVSGAFSSLLSQLSQQQVVVVFTSGGPISVIAQQLLGLPDDKMLSLNWTLANCGITKIVQTPNRVLLATLNEHSHFENAQQPNMITYK